MRDAPDKHYNIYMTPNGYICDCADIVTKWGRRDHQPRDLDELMRQAESHKVHYHELLGDTVTIHTFKKEN